VGAEVNYGIRFEAEAEAERFVGDLAEEVAARLAGGAAGRPRGRDARSSCEHLRPLAGGMGRARRLAGAWHRLTRVWARCRVGGSADRSRGVAAAQALAAAP
jgi:hypothetical protein